MKLTSQKILFFCLALFFIQACKQNQEAELIPTSTQNAKRDKSGHIYSAQAVALANNALFVAHYDALTGFILKPYNAFMVVPVEDQSAYDVELAQRVQNYTQNPTTANANAYASYIGFVDFQEFTSGAILISTTRNSLIQNYAGFAGLSSGEIDGLILEANEYRDENGHGRPTPPDFNFGLYKICMLNAVYQLERDIDGASSVGGFTQAVGTYEYASAQCYKIYRHKP